MNDYFESEIGAYTSFTERELEKSTYNVKADIRNILIQKLGRENIPIVNESINQFITFLTCARAKAYREGSLSIQCKFSKQNSDEMTILWVVK